MLAPLLPLYLVDYVYSQAAMRSHQPYVESWYDLMHGLIDADVVAMGNSHTYNQIDPAILDSILCANTYNLGISGRNLDGQIHKYNLYRKYNKKPRLIIQNIDLWLFVTRTDLDKYQFFPYFWNRNMRKEFFQSETFSFGEKYLPMYRYFGYWEYFSRYPQRLYKGFVNSNSPWNGTIKSESITFFYDENKARLFDEYLADITSEGIKIVLFYPPTYYTYKNKVSNIDEMYKTFQFYADKYDIPILDYISMPICNDSSYFQNVHHLNRLGTKVFSDSLANDIKKLGIL